MFVLTHAVVRESSLTSSDAIDITASIPALITQHSNGNNDSELFGDIKFA